MKESLFLIVLLIVGYAVFGDPYGIKESKVRINVKKGVVKKFKRGQFKITEEQKN